jgi:hypothetical protein
MLRVDSEAAGGPQSHQVAFTGPPKSRLWTAKSVAPDNVVIATQKCKYWFRESQVVFRMTAIRLEFVKSHDCVARSPQQEIALMVLSARFRAFAVACACEWIGRWWPRCSATLLGVSQA